MQGGEISPPLIALMARRGPDDEGCWSDGQYVALGVRRLAILDLSPTGHQPMLTQDGRYAIVYNGEVYNFRECVRNWNKGGFASARPGIQKSSFMLSPNGKWSFMPI